MPITAPKPVTESEFRERMEVAKKYGPVAVHNLIDEFRRRVSRPELEAENAFGFVNLQKCGLEVATADDPAIVIGGDGRLSKRRSSPELDKLKRRMAAHDGPPTKEEIAEHLRLTSGEHDNTEAIIAGLMAGPVVGGSVAKSYTPTQAEIAQDGSRTRKSIHEVAGGWRGTRKRNCPGTHRPDREARGVRCEADSPWLGISRPGRRCGRGPSRRVALQELRTERTAARSKHTQPLPRGPRLGFCRQARTVVPAHSERCSSVWQSASVDPAEHAPAGLRVLFL